MLRMKRRFALFNLTLMAVVLLTTAYQSFHAFSHVAQSQGCEHTHNKQEKHIKHFGSHHDHDNDKCHICDFHFDFFVAPQQFCLRLDFPFYETEYRFSSKEATPSFTGSLFSHRGPPSV